MIDHQNNNFGFVNIDEFFKEMGTKIKFNSYNKIEIIYQI